MHVIEGREVQLPVEVRVASSTLATWLLPTGPVADLIAPTGLTPYGPVKGRSLVSVGMIRYVDSDLGAYHEFAVAVVVKQAGKVATLIHQLPVDQSFTLAAGREIWGFPKFMSTGSIVADRGSVVGTLAADGEPILTMWVDRGLIPVPARTTELDTYSYMDGVLRKVPFTMRTAGVRARPGGAHLSLGDRHPMARELASIGLPARPLSIMHVARMSATFGAPEVITL